MNFIEEINRHKYLYLDSISEPEDNVLRLVITEATANGPEERIVVEGVIIPGSRAIETVSGCASYEVQFDSYIGYSVTNESYAQDSDQDEFIGKLARLYSESAYLKYISASTFATSDYPGPFKHYGFCCLNHCIDVVSILEPTVVLSRVT